MKKFILTAVFALVSIVSFGQEFDVYLKSVQTLEYGNDNCYRIELIVKCLENSSYYIDELRLDGTEKIEHYDPFTYEFTYEIKEGSIWAMESSEISPWISKSFYQPNGKITKDKEYSIKFDLNPNQYLNQHYNDSPYILNIVMQTYHYGLTPNNRPSKKFIFDQFNIEEGIHLQSYEEWNNVQTLINNIEISQNNKFYDLTGKVVEYPAKGNVYIYNNKKIIY